MKSAPILFLCLFGLTLLKQGWCKPSEDPEYLQDKEGDENYEDDVEDEEGPPPKMLSKSATMELSSNATALLPCDVDGNPDKFARVWRKGGNGLYTGTIRHTTDARIMELSNGALEIKQVGVSDEGEYTCFISKTDQVVYTLLIKVPAKITEMHPKEKMTFLKEHGSLTLTCVAGVGLPKPEVKWFKNDYALEQVKDDGNVQTASYTIMNATVKDSGIYKCTAHNQVDSSPDSREIEVQVVYPPIVKIAEGEDTVATGEGYESKLRCIVTAPKKSHVKWYKNGLPIEQTDSIFLEKKEHNYYLRIPKTKVEDFGMYECKAKNGEGETSAVIELTGKPKAIYKEFKTTQETNEPVLVFSTISFAPIEEYELLYKMQEDEDWVSLRPTPSVTNPVEGTANYVLEQEISDLKPGFYVAKLRAKNAFGWSAYATAEFPKEHEGDLKPTGGLLAVESSSAELRISFAMLMSIMIAHIYC